MSATLGPDPTIDPESAPAVASATPDVAERSAEVALPATAEPPDEVILVAAAESPPSPTPISVTRRRFIGFGLTLLAGVAGAAVLGRLAPVFADETALPSPLVPTYDPTSKAWTFVVDTARVHRLRPVRRRLQGREPRARGAASSTGRGSSVTRSPPTGPSSSTRRRPGSSGVPADLDRAGRRGRRRSRRLLRPAPVHAVRELAVHHRLPGRGDLPDRRRDHPRRCQTAASAAATASSPARTAPATSSRPATPRHGHAGVADKCTWCYHRISQGLLPACVEVCPVGARMFGDRNDPRARSSKVVRRDAPRPAARSSGRGRASSTSARSRRRPDDDQRWTGMPLRTGR